MERRSFPNKSLLACAALACATLSAPTLAQTWNNIVIEPTEEYFHTLTGLQQAAGGKLYYSFTTPVGITQLRVETSGGSGNANLKVFRDSPNAVPACDLRQLTSNEVCTQGWSDPNDAKTPAATWYVEVSAASPFSGVALTVGYLPEFVALDHLPDMPFAIARRGAFPTSGALPGDCLEVPDGVGEIALPKAACVPVGAQQAWHFQMRDNNYRIENLQGNRCLAANDFDLVVVAECNELDKGQRWNVLGGAKSTHYVVLQNLRTKTCLDYEPGTKTTALVPCRLGQAEMPAWNLRGFGERMTEGMASDGSTFSLIAGTLCLGDNRTTAYLVDCADRTATRRYMYPALLWSDKLDWFDKDFVMQSGPDKNWCMGADANNNIVFRQECETSDPDLRWQVDLFSTKSSEWKIRHVRQGKCLVSKNGAITAGTPIVLDDCSRTETTTRWRHVAN
jgi:hypothetical protein